MQKYVDIFLNSFSGYFNYLVQEITNPKLTGYFYWLIGLSILVMILEVVFPWRKQQKFIRDGFWLDLFYIFFNFFLFSLIGYNAVSNVVVNLFNDALAGIGIENIVAINIATLPVWVQLLIMFVMLISFSGMFTYNYTKETGFGSSIRYIIV